MAEMTGFSEGRLIDLRSDTVTRPNEKMRRAMAEAEVGDDVFAEDPTVNRLQERAAEIFGKEAGLYVPSGSMGNLCALMTLAPRGTEVIVERKSHIYNYEMGSVSALAGLLPRIVDGTDGILDPADVEAAIHPQGGHLTPTSLVCVENTHNMAGGTVYTVEQCRALADVAHRNGLKAHLDGARVFNAATALGTTVKEIAAPFDTASFCFSKGLGAPIGSMLVGPQKTINEARVHRKRLGGGMRQVGVVAAAAMVSLEDSPARLHEDHENAAYLAREIAVMGLGIDPEKVRTNIVIFDVSETGMHALQFLQKLRQAGVLAVPTGAFQIRMVTHCDVNRTDCERAIEALRQVVGGEVEARA